jgi:hypothetical protein
VYDKLFALNSQTVGVVSKRIITHGVLLTNRTGFEYNAVEKKM